ncbi:hypothetical protein LCM20_16615 [Halobacillus litoralis]|uniref:hypothetical protein n=1 Tax=Halobacillus litoralis TaxID=45668 RepID=UPI001CD46087|nr:hypothetical protein [Halobacillus litoralis]MCA0972233.1 hypothetical protein [Halobacillus litoralis]
MKTDIETRLRNTLSNGKDQALQFARSKPVRDAIQMKALSNRARDLYTRAGNVFNPDRIKNVMQSTYDKVIQGPVSRVSRFTSRTVNSMVDSTMPQTQMAGVRGGMDWRSVEDTYRFAKGESSGVSTEVEFTKGFDVDPKYSSYEQRVKTTPVNKGAWSNERAESIFISDKIGEIKRYLDEAGVDGVEYKNGMPDFSPFSKGEIKLENMTNDKKLNFSAADRKMPDPQPFTIVKCWGSGTF